MSWNHWRSEGVGLLRGGTPRQCEAGTDVSFPIGHRDSAPPQNCFLIHYIRQEWHAWLADKGRSQKELPGVI